MEAEGLPRTTIHSGVDEVSGLNKHVHERKKRGKTLLMVVEEGNSPLDEVRPLFARPPSQFFIFPHLVERGRDLGAVLFAVDEVGDENV